MATFRPPKRGISISRAIAEAYASAPESAIILDTLELRHPLFVDGSGNPTAARIVNDHTPLVATLEATAPINGGAAVTFQPVPFEFMRMGETESGAALDFTVEVSNVARLLIPYLDLTKGSQELMTLTWRQYLADDLTTPHILPPVTLTCKQASATMSSIRVRASFSELINRRFPAREYTAKSHPGLTVR